MLFSLSPFGRDHLAFGAGMQRRPWTRTTNIYLSQVLCEYSPQLCKHEWMYIWSSILYVWIFIYNDKVKLTNSEFPGCVCMKKQRFWLSLFTVCLNLKELWNIRTFTCLTFNRKNLGSFKAASCFSSLKPAHSCTWQFAGCTHVSSNTHSGEDCVSLSKTWISCFLQTQVTTKKQRCQVVPTGIVSGNATIQL